MEEWGGARRDILDGLGLRIRIGDFVPFLRARACLRRRFALFWADVVQRIVDGDRDSGGLASRGRLCTHVQVDHFQDNLRKCELGTW